jgi:hypothetical protein
MGHCHIEPGTLPATFIEELALAFDFARASGAEATSTLTGASSLGSVPSAGWRRYWPWTARAAGLWRMKLRGLQSFDAGRPRHYL